MIHLGTIQDYWLVSIQFYERQYFLVHQSFVGLFHFRKILNAMNHLCRYLKIHENK